MPLSSLKKNGQYRGAVLIEFALSLLLVIPVLVFLYAYFEVIVLKRDVEQCLLTTAQAASQYTAPLSAANESTLRTICRHGNPDSNTPLINGELANATISFSSSTVDLLDAAGNTYQQPVVTIDVSVPFNPTIFSKTVSDQYLPINDVQSRLVRVYDVP